MPSLRPLELKTRLESDLAPVVVDVRDPEEFARAAIPGAYNVPFDESVATGVSRAVPDRSRHVVFVCGWGHRSAIASIALRREGFRHVDYLEGGLEAWGLAALPVSPGREPLVLEPDRPRAGD